MVEGPAQERPAPEESGGRQAGVSIAALARHGVGTALTTAEINRIIADNPEWLAAERESYRQMLRERRERKAQRANVDR